MDNELHEVDSLLTDLEKQRFVAKGVYGVENPKRLSNYIRVMDWVPVDAHIQVSDVCSLIRSLGGENLYGDDKTVPLRELIQNASDAVRARRLIDSKDKDWGDVIVRMGDDDEGHWIEVEDTGVGMSVDILSGVFLDFGKSGWESDQIIQTFPTLLSKGFESTGQYGIGFYSVFMWGEHVRVTTRQFDAAREKTLQLEFLGGLNRRPIIMNAKRDAWMRDGGTCVRVWLSEDPYSQNGLLSSDASSPSRLEHLCAWLAPSIDVNLYVQISESRKKLVVRANDWSSITEHELRLRICGECEEDTRE